LQLLSLFEYGFTSSAGRNASLLRYSTQTRLQPRYLQTRNATPIRRFTASSIKAVGPKEDSLTDADLEALSIEAEPKQAVRTDQEIAAAAIESVVRQARQTFGETLPKNYRKRNISYTNDYMALHCETHSLEIWNIYHREKAKRKLSPTRYAM